MKKLLYILPILLLPSCYADYLGGHYVEDGRGQQAALTGVVQSALEPSRQWEAGDQVAVTTSYYDQSALNRIYTCAEDGQSFTPDTKVPIYIKGTGLLLAYYPVQGADGSEPEALGLSTVDQSKPTSFLFAREPIKLGDSNIQLHFRHILGQMKVNITALQPGEQIHTVVLKGFYHRASVDPYSWEVYLGNNNPEEYMFSQTDPVSSFTLSLIPQSIAADAAEPAYLSLVGKLRSYDVPLGAVTILSDQLLTASVDISGPAPNVDFTYETATWTESGKGGDISSHSTINHKSKI